MNIKDFIICPLCREPMEADGNILCCTGQRRHCYDKAASGYVNLLPPGKKSNAKTGDDREMLKSRREFLSGGFYDKISETAARIALESLSDRPYTIVFADAGCGEGYHALNIRDYYSSLGLDSFPIGLEASKCGADMAAKLAKNRNAKAFFAAANIFDMPIHDKCCDIVFSMFAPVPDGEAARILKDDGVLLVCSSGSYHLLEMREVLYGEPIISPPLDRTPEGFYHVSNHKEEYSFTLTSKEQIAALFTMTPFYWRCKKESRERLLSLDNLTLRACTEYNVYKKK